LRLCWLTLDKGVCLVGATKHKRRVSSHTWFILASSESEALTGLHLSAGAEKTVWLLFCCGCRYAKHGAAAAGPASEHGSTWLLLSAYWRLSEHSTSGTALLFFGAS
jgi:hypothetical protein